MARVSRRIAIGILFGNVILAAIIASVIGMALSNRVHRYDELIKRTARKYDVDPMLVSSVIWQESRFRADRVGSKQEIGLMQVTEAAAREWARATRVTSFKRNDLFNPATNIEAGTWYLARALRRWSHCSDPVPFALAEYNAGPSNAKRWALKAGTDAQRFHSSITYPQTRKYVSQIMKRYGRLKADAEGA